MSWAVQCQRGALLVLLALLVQGCASKPAAVSNRPFTFGHDTFAFANELVWEYGWDSQGHWRGKPRTPRPEYSQRCFVLTRAAIQFFGHATFDPNAPRVDDLTYRRLIHEVLASNPRKLSPDDARIRIPGYPDLRTFSAELEPLLKREAGGAWMSYFQRGHWRMVFPFSRRSQERTSRRLIAAVESNRPAVAHLVCFPSLRINHAVLVFAARASARQIEFGIYDPNIPERPGTLIYDRATRTFQFPATSYFPGGTLNVYEVFRGLCY